MNKSRIQTAFFLTFLSGAAALAHETIWTRRLVDLLGASAETFSKVVGAFFLGLALGAWFASRHQTRTNAWRCVATAELAVALLALPALFSPALGEFIFLTGAPVNLLKFLLPLALVAPPAFAMGLVLPWLVRALADHGESSPNRLVWLYAVNTAGGLCGIAVILLAPIPSLGLTLTGLALCGVNALIAIAVLVLGRNAGANAPVSPAVEAEPGADGKKFYLLAFLSGFLVLSLEVLLQHQLAQVTINSLFSGGTVLGLVLISLVIAAALVPPLLRRFGEKNALGIGLFCAAALGAVQPFLLTELRADLAILPYELTALPYTFEILKIGAVAVLPAVVAAGLVFPLLLRGHSTGGPATARRLGVLLAWNGLGGWLGTEFAQNFLAPRFGLWTSVELLAAGYAAIWLTWATRAGNFKARLAPAAVLAGFLIFCTLQSRALPQATILSRERLAAVKIGREGVVATVECGPGDWRILFNNSYTLGGSRAQFNQERQGLLPLLLHGNPRSAATLGVATGSTAAGVALHPGIERCDAIELSPLVLRFADEFFTPYNRDVFRDPRARFIQEDARWVMARERAAYDVIVGDLFLPWRTGEGRLFTREHFQNVRRALKAGGLYCQWLPLFQLTRPQFDAIARTFREVFPDAFLVRGDFYCDLPIIGLVGGGDFAKLDWTAVADGCAQVRQAGVAKDPLVRHVEGVAMLLLGPLPDPGPGPVNTLANAWLEWDAARNILGMTTPWFFGIPCAEYVRDLQRRSQRLLPEALRSAHEAGEFFLTLEVAAKMNLPARAELEAQIPQRLPLAMRNDSAAEWRQWPSRVKPGSM